MEDQSKRECCAEADVVVLLHIDIRSFFRYALFLSAFFDITPFSLSTPLPYLINTTTSQHKRFLHQSTLYL